MMKAYKERMGFDEIWPHLENCPLAYLATIDGEQPRVRPMSLIAYERQLYLATKTTWAKVEQLYRNRRVELAVALKTEGETGSIRITATAIFIDDQVVREKLASIIPWFGQYWNGADDANFTLLMLRPRCILYDNPYDGKKYTVNIE
jgi:uncharacterized pyridoxamine 5'-phosphate oxidase family protein